MDLTSEWKVSLQPFTCVGPWTLFSSPVQGDNHSTPDYAGEQVHLFCESWFWKYFVHCRSCSPITPLSSCSEPLTSLRRKQQQGLGWGEGGDASGWSAQAGSCTVPTEDTNFLMESPGSPLGLGLGCFPSSCARMGGAEHGLCSQGRAPAP